MVGQYDITNKGSNPLPILIGSSNWLGRFNDTNKGSSPLTTSKQNKC